MSHWPVSFPDYAWPEAMFQARGAVRRWLLAAAFYVAHYFGRGLGVFSFQKPSVLVIRTDGIGDAVLFEPALRSLADHFYGRELHLWAPAATCELMRACHAITRRRVVPRGYKGGNLLYFYSFAWRARLGYRLGRWKFEAVAYLAESPEPLANWLFTSARADARWLNPGDLENQLDWQRAKTIDAASRLFSPRRGGGHELVRNQHLSAKWDDGYYDNLPAPQVHLDDKADRKAAKQIGEWRNLARQIDATAVVGLVGVGSLEVNRYPFDKWAQVAKRMWSENHVACAILAGPHDRPAARELSLALDEVPHLILRRSLDIVAMSALIARLDGILSVDTGLAHIALAVGVPTIVVVGGGHPGRFFPWPLPWPGGGCAVLNKPMPCEGCLCRCKLAEPECVTHVNPDDVVGAARALLGLRSRDQRQLPMRQAG